MHELIYGNKDNFDYSFAMGVNSKAKIIKQSLNFLQWSQAFDTFLAVYVCEHKTHSAAVTCELMKDLLTKFTGVHEKW